MNAPDRVRNLPRSANRPEDLVGFDMIRRLVAFPTVSRDSNLELIEWVRGYLEDLGATTALTFDDEQRKANLFATLPAQDGNAIRGGIVLSGHTDVVPVDGQPWDTNPFEATVIGHRLHGRGVTDILGYAPKELVGRKIESVVAGGAGVDPAQDWQRFLIDGRQEGEYSMLDRDGGAVRLRYRARAHHPIPGYHLSRLRPTD